jgi:hypothetical protein
MAELSLRRRPVGDIDAAPEVAGELAIEASMLRAGREQRDKPARGHHWGYRAGAGTPSEALAIINGHLARRPAVAQ